MSIVEAVKAEEGGGVDVGDPELPEVAPKPAVLADEPVKMRERIRFSFDAGTKLYNVSYSLEKVPARKFRRSHQFDRPGSSHPRRRASRSAGAVTLRLK